MNEKSSSAVAGAYLRSGPWWTAALLLFAISGSLPAGEAPKDPAAEKAAREARAKAEARERAEDRARLIRLVAQVSAQDSGLRAAFLKEAEAKVAGEDPALREWTEATLACLDAAGEADKYLRMLEDLVKAEPRDPTWPRRLAQEYLQQRKRKEWRELMEKISDDNPDDFQIAQQLHTLCLQGNEKDKAEKYAQRMVEGALRDLNIAYHYAYYWQQSQPELALRLWRVLEKKGVYADNGYATYMVAALLNQTGKTGEALDAYLILLLSNTSHSPTAAQSLLAFSVQEEHLRKIREAFKQILSSKPSPQRAITVHLFRYQLEKQRGNKDEARAALEAATEFSAAEDFNLAQQVLTHILQEYPSPAAEEGRAAIYARTGGELRPEQRRSLLRYFAQTTKHLRLMRELCADPEECAPQDRLALAQMLVSSNEYDEAEKLITSALEDLGDSNLYNVLQPIIRNLIDRLEGTRAEKLLQRLIAPQNGWMVYQLWQTAVAHYQQRGQSGQAVLAAAKMLEALAHDTSGYRYQAEIHFAGVCNHAASHGQLKDKAYTLARQYALASARRAFTEGVLYPPHFSHYAHHFSNWSASALKNLDLEDELRKLAEEAAASENPHRVTAAAGFYGGRGDTEKAIRLYQKAYEMPGSDRRNLAYYLYQHYYQRKTKTDLEKALEMLETMRKTGNPNFSGYNQEWNYLQSKVSLLYQLDKKDEARALVRECFGKTAFSRQGYWSYSQLATHAQNAKDWALAAEVYEQMIRIMRRQPGVSQDWSTLSNFYLSCANAYAEAGEAQKAVDSLLRGLSLIPREQSQWYQQIVQETLRRSLKGKSLDAVVAEHEKQVAATGAEKPHLRLVFAEAYRQAGKTREMLRQQRIAANLMLKDVPLRRQIVDAYLGLGEKESAIEALLEWARFDAQNLEIYQRLGDLYQQMGKAEQAILAWATMAEVRPREAEGYRAYAKKLCDIKLLDEAAVAFRKAVKYRPTEFAIAEELSQVYSGLNQQDRIPALWTDGESACRKAIEDFKDDPTPWLSLGRFLVKQNRRQEARKLYEEICRRHWPRFHSETVNEASQQLHKL